MKGYTHIYVTKQMRLARKARRILSKLILSCGLPRHDSDQGKALKELREMAIKVEQLFPEPWQVADFAGELNAIEEREIYGSRCVK